MTYTKQLILRTPSLADEAAFDLVRDIPNQNGQTFLLNYTPQMPYREFLKICEDQSQVINLPKGFVPATFYFGFVEGKIVGRLSFRWELNDFLLKVGGHIGYAVIPSEQRKGYASEMLAQALLIARQKGMKKILLTCDEGNLGSMKTIERNKGVLEDIYSGPGASVPKRRYWIATA